MNTTGQTEVGSVLEPIGINFFVSGVCIMLQSGKVFAFQAAALGAVWLDTICVPL